MFRFEMPDRRAAYALVGAFLLGLVYAIAITGHPEGSFAHASEIALYSYIVVLGVVFTYLSLKDGFALIHPSVTRESSPNLFWLEVGVSYPALIVAGLWFIAQS